MRYTLRSGKPSEAEITFYGNVRQAINCKDPELILSGPRDTGKTLGLLYKLHCLAWKYPGASIVIARKRATDLNSTVIQTYRHKVLRPEELVHPYGGESPAWFNYPNGSRIWMAGLDKPGKVLSAEHDIIYVNQAEEISLLDWMALLGSTTGRAGHIPNPQLLGDCNPASPTHWIRTRAKSSYNPDGALTLIESRHQDNPDLYDQTTGELTPMGESRLGRLRSLTGHLLQRWYYGMWVAPEGAIYSVFDEAHHKVRAFPIPALWPRFVGIDPVGAYVAAVWLALDPTNHVLNVYREYYKPFGIPTNQHAANILRLSGYQPNGRPLTAAAAEPIHYWVVGQPAERQARADWTASGIPASTPAFSDLWMGIDRVNAILSENSLVIHDSCPLLLSEIGDYRRTLRDGVPTENIENKEVYHCLVGGTMVTTNRGNVPIRGVVPGDMVLTRMGYKRVLGSVCTQPDANVYNVTFFNGTTLTGTANHRIWVKGKGYVDLRLLRQGDAILAIEEVTASNAFAPVCVLGITALPQREPVYNLEVEDAHEFFANGVLVHNCLDALRYAIVGPEGLGTKQQLIDLRQPIGPQW